MHLFTFHSLPYAYSNIRLCILLVVCSVCIFEHLEYMCAVFICIPSLQNFFRASAFISAPMMSTCEQILYGCMAQAELNTGPSMSFDHMLKLTVWCSTCDKLITTQNLSLRGTRSKLKSYQTKPNGFCPPKF